MTAMVNRGLSVSGRDTASGGAASAGTAGSSPAFRRKDVCSMTRPELLSGKRTPAERSVNVYSSYVSPDSDPSGNLGGLIPAWVNSSPNSRLSLLTSIR